MKMGLQFSAVTQVCDPTSGTSYPESEIGGTSRRSLRVLYGRVAEVGANSSTAQTTPVNRRAQVSSIILDWFRKG